ncbi:hypothetical protein AXF42_Ash006985 [Apostasia shenzhenica]|uniref:Uncharacterized protein n=1 Tax=Apostasia shenzhenica TaxID=1088818 RepID=A0A2I0BES8_9ASPA|nr:hypothetical protein AXF42_Ash006985 [Apostasia shenzhenica]
MSSENEDGVSPPSPCGNCMLELDPMKPTIRYTRDFLLSFSELDVCKKLPSGIDQSLLSELEEAASFPFDRQRSLGSLSLQGPRRGEYGSQSMNRSDGYTRGSSGRWDARSTGSSDRDGDLQSDRESFVHDSGRRFGAHSRRVPQHGEHDGLLGSGAFARASGYTGAPPTKARGNGRSQLTRTAEPYQPPRPYKATPYSRKDNTDSCNDETFGSTECSSEDRAEQERRRRESFELMRKEQHKALQEKQKHGKDSPKENLDTDIMTLLQNSDTDKSTKNGSKPDESTSSLYSSSSKASSHIHVPAARPLVPPGFAGALGREKNHQVHSPGTIDASQVSNASVSDDFLPHDVGSDHVHENDFTAHTIQNMQKIELKCTSLLSVDEKEKSPIVSSSIQTNTSFNNITFNTSIFPKVDVWHDILNGPSNDKEANSDAVNVVNEENSTSILNKLFGGAMATKFDSPANDNENHAIKAEDEARNHLAASSSKFAHLFLEESEGKNPTENISSRDLLSLIVNNDEVGPKVHVASNDESIKQMQSSLPSESNDTSRLLTSPSSPMSMIHTNFYQIDRKTPCAVLTCEDLEQSILAEMKDSGSSSQFSRGSSSTLIDANSEEHKDAVDNNASQHLLSLLHMGSNLKDTLSSAIPAVIGSSEMVAASEGEANLHVPAVDSGGTEHTSEKRLTLEALFGAAFMNELHSTEAPISAQRGSINNDATGSPGLPFNSADELISPSPEHTNKAILEDEMLQFSNNVKHTRDHNIHLPEEAAGDIHLPEEDSLISLNESMDPLASYSLRFAKDNRNEPLLPEKPAVDLNDKMLHAFLRDGECSRQPVFDNPHFMRPGEVVDPDGLCHSLQGRPPPQFRHHMSYSRPFFAHPDHPTYGNPQMKFVDQDAMYPNSNMISHHSYDISGPRLDPTIHHRMVQPMPLPGYLPPHNSIPGIPRGLPLSHAMNQMHGLSPDMDNLRGFLLQRQPNHGGLAMGPVHGSAGGMEAIERVLEMEIRANPKQYRHAIPGHVPGMFGPEINMNLRYR